MRLNKKLGFIVLSWPVLFAAATPGWFSINAVAQNPKKGDVSQSIKKELIERVLQDYPNQGDCISELSQQEQEVFRRDSFIKEVDLNHDGQYEYEIFGQGSCSCGAQNCSIWIYRKTADGFKSIFDSNGVDFEVGHTAHNRFDDLIVTSHNSAATQFRVTYMFDGERYHEYKNDFVNLETGQVKPAEVRVHFKRGTSSTTLSGKVSVGFPDTYVVGAREGQTMAIEIAARKGAVSFVVIDPAMNTIVSNRPAGWKGTLLAQGDYRILVDGNRSGAYSITISVQ